MPRKRGYRRSASEIMVVRSEKARLHEHGVGNAIRVQYIDVVFASCVIIGRITANICKGEAALEDVRMA